LSHKSPREKQPWVKPVLSPDTPDYPDENPDSPGQVQRSQKLDKCEWKTDRVILELTGSASKTIQPDKLDRKPCIQVDRPQTLTKLTCKQISSKTSKATTSDTGFVSRSSHTKVLRLRWGRVQKTVLKNPYTPHPRARPTLKPEVTYYGFLGEEWSLQTSRGSHNAAWALTSMPSHLGAQSSKSNRLESAGSTKN